MSVRAIFGLDVVAGSVFSPDQIYNICLTMGGTIYDLPSMVGYIESIIPLAQLANQLRDSPATVELPSALIYDLRQSILPLKQNDSRVNYENVFSRIIYWRHDVDVMGTYEFHESRVLQALDQIWIGINRFGTAVVIESSNFHVLAKHEQIDTMTALVYDRLKTQIPNLQWMPIVDPQMDPLDFITSHVLRLPQIQHFEWFHTKEKPNFKCEFAFPELAYPVAALDFVKLLQYFYIYATDLQVKEEIRAMELHLQTITNGLEFNLVIPQMESRLMDLLPEGFAEYVGKDVWVKICFQLCSDPLINILNKMKPEERNKFAGFSPDVHLNIYEMTHAIRTRESIEPTTISTTYPHPSNLIKPLDVENINEYQRSIVRCDEIIEESFQLIQQEIQELMTQTETADMVKIHNIRVLNENEMNKGRFYAKGLSGWNFPLLKTSNLLTRLEPRFGIYSVNKQELIHLLQFDTFVLYLIIRVWIFVLTQHTSQDMEVVRESLMAFYNVAQADHTRSVLCALLNIVRFMPPQCDQSQARKTFLQARQIYESMVRK